jgi:hypothetical protein
VCLTGGARPRPRLFMTVRHVLNPPRDAGTHMHVHMYARAHMPANTDTNAPGHIFVSARVCWSVGAQTALRGKRRAASGRSACTDFLRAIAEWRDMLPCEYVAACAGDIARTNGQARLRTHSSLCVYSRRLVCARLLLSYWWEGLVQTTWHARERTHANCSHAAA